MIHEYLHHTMKIFILMNQHLNISTDELGPRNESPTIDRMHEERAQT